MEYLPAIIDTVFSTNLTSEKFIGRLRSTLCEAFNYSSISLSQNTNPNKLLPICMAKTSKIANNHIILARHRINTHQIFTLTHIKYQKHETKITDTITNQAHNYNKISVKSEEKEKELKAGRNQNYLSREPD